MLDKEGEQAEFLRRYGNDLSAGAQFGSVEIEMKFSEVKRTLLGLWR